MPTINLGRVKGDTGDAATLSLGTVSTGAAGSNAAITNTGTAGAAVFNFTIPRGDKGETGNTGQQGLKGDTGNAATISLGTVSTGAAGSSAAITNTGTAGAAVFNFVIPRGDKGETGNTGNAATISIGTVTTGAAGSSASINNSGTSGAAVLDFSIPRGDQGIQGTQGIQGETGPAGPEPSLNVTDNSATAITLSDANNNRIVRCTAATAVTITVPSTLAAGFSCMVIQAGAGQVTFAAGSGTTLNSFGNLISTAGQHAPASLIRVGSGVYNLSGNLV